MKVLVGSENPVKVGAVKEAFSKYWPDVEVVGMKVPSGVPDQPINDQTFEGARNRALNLRRVNEERSLGAKFFVGMEGGVVQMHSRWFVFSGVCIADEKGRLGFGTSPNFELPDITARDVLAGMELGDAMDKLRGDHNTKQKDGAAGFFSKGVLDRKSNFVYGVISALIPFLNRDLFFNDLKEEPE